MGSVQNQHPVNESETAYFTKHVMLSYILYFALTSRLTLPMYVCAKLHCI